jgi:hypothetical protein
LLAASSAWGQLPSSQPQTLDISAWIEIELRLKTAENKTARVHVAQFKTLNAATYLVTIPCWNKASVCPAVTAVTAKAFVKLPWTTLKYNVTNRLLGPGTEVQLYFDSGTPEGSASFPAIAPKPGEAYRFRYDRVKGRLTLASVFVLPVVSADGTTMPPTAELIDATGARWTTGTSSTAGQVSVLRNGTQVRGSVMFVTIKGGQVYISDDGWFRWDGTAWVASSAP